MTSEIRSFRIDVADDVLEDLRRRLTATRWPEREPVADWSQGIPLATVQELCRYWADEYDWREREASLNRHPGYLVEIDGLDIHFQHVRSSNPGALPVVITHGWPGSIVEFQKLIPLLTEPQDHGGDADDAFHVVCPALPGYGFSGKPTATGWSVQRTAGAWAELMSRLGYRRYVAQGGDWGSAVTTAIGIDAPEGLVAIHTNMPLAAPDPATADDLTEHEQAVIAAMRHYDQWDSGYSRQQSTRPQTLGYALVDSPAGQLAWIMEKVSVWTDRERPVTELFGTDELLDNVMMYWVTASGASSARLYWESFRKMAMGTVGVPTCVSTFPNEILPVSRRWCESKRYPQIAYWNDLDEGGHFPAWQLPEVFAGELRSAFRQFR